ncbi:MAG: hypothetical protein NTU41_09250 [Chloroflexi bacterium]|nr:hypothetical protein [Chloroflexota bacterium]
MDFPKVVITTDVLTPPLFGPEAHSIEYRRDPLTDVPCRINVARAKRLRQIAATLDPHEIAGDTEHCAFCPENVERATPLFPETICPGGRIRKGECWLFPNLFPLAQYHATGTLSSRHYLELDQFEVAMLTDSMMAVKQYLTAVSRHGGEAVFPIYLWNHLAPSAASMVHPHVQVLVDRWPTPYQEMLLERSRDYLSGAGRSYWHDLVEEERNRGQRYIGRSNSWDVVASYAPQGNREMQIISTEASSLTDLSESEMADFADCLTRLLHGYQRLGVNSFNLSTFSAPMGARLPYYSLHAKLIARPVFQPLYRNDTGILERFHRDADIEVTPETAAEAMRLSFERGA